MSRPLPWKFASGATVLGHYRVSQISGAIAATPAALDHWARIRWVPTNANAKLVLCRLQVGLSVSGAVTTLVQQTLRATIARSYTTDHDTAITNISMAAGSNRMDSGNMSTSQMGATGPGICTTLPMTGQTFTLDNAPFARVDLPLITAVTATGTAIAGPVGIASGMKDLYVWDSLGEHPPTLRTGEGIVVATELTGHATGTLTLRTVWSWAEVINPFGQD